MPESEPIIIFRRVPPGTDRDGLESFARLLKYRVAKGAEFSCVVTGDADLRRMNRTFLGRDYPTDVLSFPSGSGGLGDIAVSYRRARAQAAEFGHSLEQEIKILMLHGLLHLRGMDHERDGGQMRRAESAWRRRLALPPCLIERAHA